MQAEVTSRLWISTPVIASPALSLAVGYGARVFLKLDNLQPSGSFKSRGIGNIARNRKANGACGFFASSGGNAGLALAVAAKNLHLPSVVVCPRSTSDFMMAKIAAEGAQTIVNGLDWYEADQHCRKLLKNSPGWAYIPPFEDQDIYDGNSTIVDELADAVQRNEIVKPDAIFCTVGGGGLLVGIIQGLIRHGWNKTVVYAVETEGAASFSASFYAKKLVTLKRIDTIATTLGARTVCQEALNQSVLHPCKPVIVSDKEAFIALETLATHHRLLVEPACSAGVAALYKKDIRDSLAGKNIVMIICGGSNVSLSMIDFFRKNVCPV